MNGCVDKLFDIDSIKLPEEITKIEIDNRRIDDDVARLALRYADENEADSVSDGDIVFCKADDESFPDKRTIIIYTGVVLPDAETAAKAVIGKGKGETVKTEIAGKAVSLNIEKIVRRTPTKIDDELICKIGIDGVTTVDGYKSYLKDKMIEDAKMEQNKAAIRYIMDKMVQNSTYSYDEAEMEKHIKSCADDYARECEATGEEFNPDTLREAIIFQEKQSWMAEAFCKSRNIELDMNDIEQQANQMIEMYELLGEKAPSKEDALKMAKIDAALNGFFDYISNIISQNTEA
mgnify:CR=1 FL=1